VASDLRLADALGGVRLAGLSEVDQYAEPEGLQLQATDPRHDTAFERQVAELHHLGASHVTSH